MAIATRPSRRRLRSFTRPRAVLTSRLVPSQSTQTGVTCGLPSELSVARLANAGLLSRSRCEAGIAVAMRASRSEPDDAESRVVHFVPAVDPDRQESEMFDRS